jgi:hypothetical protein
MKTKLFLFSLIILFLNSCSNDCETTTEPVADEVYITGTQLGVNYNQAKLYKDGVAQPLAGSQPNSQAMKVLVHSNDVYVLGNILSEMPMSYMPIKAVLWKNGQIHWEEFGSVAHDMFIQNGDIYISGHTIALVLPVPPPNPLKVWKNGQVIQELAGSYSESKLFVKGNDIHLTAKLWSDIDSFSVVYFKNNQMTTLIEDNFHLPTGITVANNNDVYVSYNASFDIGGYWVNGIAQNITPNTSRMNNVKLFNNQVYLVGQDVNGIVPQAFVLTNGQKTYLNLQGNDGFEAMDVFIKNNNQYVLGERNIWINGNYQVINANLDDTFKAGSIFVR